MHETMRVAFYNVQRVGARIARPRTANGRPYNQHRKFLLLYGIPEDAAPHKGNGRTKPPSQAREVAAVGGRREYRRIHFLRKMYKSA